MFLQILLTLAHDLHSLDSRLSEIKHVLQHLQLNGDDELQMEQDRLLLEKINQLLQ